MVLVPLALRLRGQGHRHRPRGQDEGWGVLGGPVQVLRRGPPRHQGRHGHLPVNVRQDVPRHRREGGVVLAARDRRHHRQLELQRGGGHQGPDHPRHDHRPEHTGERPGRLGRDRGWSSRQGREAEGPRAPRAPEGGAGGRIGRGRKAAIRDAGTAGIYRGHAV